MSDSESGDSGGSEDSVTAVVLDYLPHGRTEDDRPQYEKSPLAYAIGESEFRLVELTLGDDADVAIGDRIPLATGEDSPVERIRDIEHEDLPSGARSELEYVVEEIVTRNEGRFVDFYNDAQPITLRLHQLNLLPGIGKKLRNNVLDERDRRPFQSFTDLESRVSGLHDPREVLVERILEELREDDLKYRTFVGGDEQPQQQD
jgi:putative nucleotide binding protein